MVVEAQEGERRRIARELHDEIGQALTGLKLTLEGHDRLPAEMVAEGRALGDVTTLRDPAVMEQLQGKITELQAEED